MFGRSKNKKSHLSRFKKKKTAPEKRELQPEGNAASVTTSTSSIQPNQDIVQKRRLFSKKKAEESNNLFLKLLAKITVSKIKANHDVIEIKGTKYALLTSLNEAEWQYFLKTFPGFAKKGDRVHTEDGEPRYQIKIGAGHFGEVGIVRKITPEVSNPNKFKVEGEFLVIKTTVFNQETIDQVKREQPTLTNERAESHASHKVTIAENEFYFNKTYLQNNQNNPAIADTFIPLDNSCTLTEAIIPAGRTQADATAYIVSSIADLGDGAHVSKELKKLQPYAAVAHTITANFAAQLLDKLSRLHKEGIYHRDLKAENLLVKSSGDIYFADFGAAIKYMQVMDENGQLKDANYEVSQLSDRNYWPPEAQLGLAGYGPQSHDAWGLGLTLLQISGIDLSGYFNQLKNGQLQTVDHFKDALAPYIQQAPAVLKISLERLLNVDPAHRYSVIKVNEGFKNTFQNDATAQWKKVTKEIFETLREENTLLAKRSQATNKSLAKLNQQVEQQNKHQKQAPILQQAVAPQIVEEPLQVNNQNADGSFQTIVIQSANYDPNNNNTNGDFITDQNTELPIQNSRLADGVHITEDENADAALQTAQQTQQDVIVEEAPPQVITESPNVDQQKPLTAEEVKQLLIDLQNSFKQLMIDYHQAVKEAEARAQQSQASQKPTVYGDLSSKSHLNKNHAGFFNQRQQQTKEKPKSILKTTPKPTE